MATPDRLAPSDPTPIASPQHVVGEGGQHIVDAEERVHVLQHASDFHAVLLAMAGHDLRQPLQIITGVHSWLSRRLTTGSEREFLRRGELAIAQLTEQLDQLIEALRLHPNAAGINLEPVEVIPLLARVCRESTTFAAQRGITIRMCHTSAVVMSDAVLLEGILRNLTRNALKYTPAGGRVLLGCRRRGLDVGIEVCDTGVGISPDHLQKVFEAFRRLDSTRSDGLGLGLFVVRRAVDLIGHRVEVRSAVGRGSCFSVIAKRADPGLPQQDLP
jgi:signal transduction histidine kinase